MKHISVGCFFVLLSVTFLVLFPGAHRSPWLEMRRKPFARNTLKESNMLNTGAFAAGRFNCGKRRWGSERPETRGMLNESHLDRKSVSVRARHLSRFRALNVGVDKMLEQFSRLTGSTQFDSL